MILNNVFNFYWLMNIRSNPQIKKKNINWDINFFLILLCLVLHEYLIEQYTFVIKHLEYMLFLYIFLIHITSKK